MKYPWDQEPFEPENAFKAFRYFLRLGPERTVEEAYSRSVPKPPSEDTFHSVWPAMLRWRQKLVFEGLERSYLRHMENLDTHKDVRVWMKWKDDWRWETRSKAFDEWGHDATIATRLMKFWSIMPNLKLRDPVNPVVIEEFECEYRVILPTDMRQLYEHANGYDGFDDQFITFWRLEEVKPDSKHSSYFQFADYLIQSEVYGVRLSSSQADVHWVEEVCTKTPIADSFTAFAERCLIGSLP